MKVTLEIDENKEGRALLDFLKQLPFVKLREPLEKKSKRKADIKLDSIFGIWKDREVSKDSLRERAWRL